MNMLIYLIPVALALGGLGLGAFLWSLKNGQYEDLDGAAWRVLDDDETPVAPVEARSLNSPQSGK
ncbi:cbb3-type cytochrome oxidase assembly protein CcoS [Rhizobium oryzicola]|uniref:Cbb3-type cytochrome oxidase assembly protein CcoS n=1 Tax=Rhizobium oryzicola TaxID=1232668 RepID=A0ABT8SPP8_9HYPH|nr:cbb3-type cytochrome oxidase assembly protein CcoS [Rhizobium oryzicola]MDO1580500.1 cbb3-type cytochrome oxidase assembly protein CcoS [Rhizobium oryzicola]